MEKDPGLTDDGQPIQAVPNVKKADNTGRDWGEGAAMAGAIIGSILTFGVGSAGAAAVAADITSNSLEDKAKNDQDKKAQDAINANQGKAQADATNQYTHSGIGVNPSGDIGTPNNAVIGNPAGINGGFQTTQQIYNNQRMQADPNVKGLMQDPSQGGQFGPWISQWAGPKAISDKREKTNISDGKKSASEFLDLVKSMGAWPKNLRI